MIKYFIRKIKQSFRLAQVPSRPVLDLVDFGRKRCVVFDVGANQGGFAGNILLRAPLATVYCFEPNKDLIPKLQQNAKDFGSILGKPRCHIIPSAVGECHGHQELIVTEFDAASSLLQVSDTCKQGWPVVNFSEKRRDLVTVIRLDDYMDEQSIRKIKLLKLDIQGFELSALKGCERRIMDIEYIVSEVQFHSLYEEAPLWFDVINYLKSFGFALIAMDGFCFDPKGKPLQADVLLRRC